MKNILVIGSGGRECMIIKKLIVDSKKLNESINIICIGSNKNPYINDNTKLIITELNSENLTNIIRKFDVIDFAIIGPENPLKYGIGDLLEYMRIPCIGPLKIYSQIETSKIFARQFIDKIGLSTHSPQYIIIKNNEKNFDLVNTSLNSITNSIVIKKNGLHGGKGVFVQGDDFNNISEIESELKKIDEDILIEEKLVGDEYSLLSITDGQGNIAHFPPIKDYKRLNNNDTGPNTGGMGCFMDKNNSLPFLTQNDITISENINSKMIEELNKMGKENACKIGYRGILYGSYIKTSDDKIYIIEFNARFGDPEGILALHSLQTNFYNLCLQCAAGELKGKLSFTNKASIGVYLVPKMYPKKEYDSYDIYINEDKINTNNVIFANVEKDNNHIYSLGSRSLFYFIEDEDLGLCFSKIYSQITNIIGNFHYRTDIGALYIDNYDKVGVSIERGAAAVKNMKQFIEKTYTPNVLGKHGDFGGQYKLGDYTLVSSIDGVGTKSLLAQKQYGSKSFINLGKDIVNHSVNDILVQGATPLFFMDYFGTDVLNLDEITNFIQGISEACIENGKFPILGGETAEMPSIYKDNKTDLVGCIVGLKDPDYFQNPIVENSILIGLKSDGPHTNGFSLINKLNITDSEIIDTFLNPHKSYLNSVNEFIEKYGCNNLLGMSHITGGGLEDNIKRVIPKNLSLNIDYNVIINNLPDWCSSIMDIGNMSLDEMLKIYNCGIGYVLIVPLELESELIKNKDYIKFGILLK
jgi:phosphoribosylamine--glycine ligase/phosphoribosylformylglycinamidine cyclo-ligase